MAIPIEFEPSSFVALLVEHWHVSGTLQTRCQLGGTRAAVNGNDVNLQIKISQLNTNTQDFSNSHLASYAMLPEG